MNYEIGASLLRKLEQANCPVASGGHVASLPHRQYARRRLHIGLPRCHVQLPFLYTAMSRLCISVCLDASQSAVHSVHVHGQIM